VLGATGNVGGKSQSSALPLANENELFFTTRQCRRGCSASARLPVTVPLAVQRLIQFLSLSLSLYLIEKTWIGELLTSIDVRRVILMQMLRCIDLARTSACFQTLLHPVRPFQLRPTCHFLQQHANVLMSPINRHVDNYV
jgi:hypothetical protein